MIRMIKIFINKNAPFLLPICIFMLHKYVLKGFFNLEVSQEFITSYLTISQGLLGTLLTVFSIFLALPETNFIKLMKEYGQYDKMNNILAVGIFLAIIIILLSIFKVKNKSNILEYLTIATLAQTLYASINLYKIAKLNSKSRKK